jgi:TRAP-type C4-dicarboxylate transport system permease large subunit
MITTIALVLAILAIAAFTNLELDDKHYDRLKWLALKWHYITAFIAAIVKVGNFPYGIETVAIVAAIGALLAGILGISAGNYYKVRSTAHEMTDEDYLEAVLSAGIDEYPEEDEEDEYEDDDEYEEDDDLDEEEENEDE